MAYATQQDMIDRFGEPRLVQLTDVGEPQTGAVVASVLQAALDDASAEIDGYLAGRYPVPMASPPAALKGYCCTLAHYRLMGAAADENTRFDVRAVRSYLEAVAKGTITLTPPDAAPAVAGVGPVLFDAGSKVMGREA